MIVDLVIQAIYLLVGAVLGFLPTEPLPPSLTSLASSAIASSGGLVTMGVFPVVQLGLALVAVRAAFLAYSLFRVAAWLLTLIHVGGGAG